MERSSGVHESQQDRADANGEDGRRHVHHGKSSRDLIDPEPVLRRAGLKAGDIFLDAGCGDGYFSIAASDVVGSGGRVHAIDLHEESLSLLREEVRRKKLNNVEVVRADITKGMPMEDHAVDFCIMANVLHGFILNGETDESIKEINRIVKMAGLITVVEFKKRADTPGPPVHERITGRDVVKAVSPFGFRKIAGFEAGPFHYAVVFLRSAS